MTRIPLDENTLREVRRWVHAERLVDNTGVPEDEAYNNAIDYVLEIIDGLMEDAA